MAGGCFLEPELMFFLYGSEVGQTPLRLEKVKEGTHKLQIKDREKEIYVKEKKTLEVGLFTVTLPPALRQHFLLHPTTTDFYT